MHPGRSPIASLMACARIAASPRRWILACCAVALLLASAPGGAADPAKVLRVATFDIETLDPHQYNDDPSFQVIQAIFEPAYEWDYLSKTPRLTPLTAAAAPEITEAGRVWTIRLKRGIYFTDDPAFNGKPRELTADDYVYSYKRWMDPNGRRAGSPVLTDLILGARALVEAAKRNGKLDYDAPIDGLCTLDRYTFQVRLAEPNYPSMRDLLGFVTAVPREVVEAAHGDIRARPVGTGPYRLKQWKQGSRIVLEANPKYREAYFPRSDDAADADLVRSMQGKRIPRAGTVEVNVVEEDTTRLLLFEQGGLDFVQLRGEIATRLLSDGGLKPSYATRGVTRDVYAEPFLFALYFNVADPTIGGMSPARIALRRAIALGYDIDALIRIVLAGQAIPANQFVPPGVGGHDPALATKPAYDPATSNALLDRFGYTKRDPDGYRRAPDGTPLTLTLSLRTGTVSRDTQTLFRKNMDAIGLRTHFELAPFQDIIKDLENGKYQLYQGGYGGSPSGYNEFAQLHGKQPQRVNVAQFHNEQFDAAAERFLRARSDAEQIAAGREMNEIARTYVPQLPLYFRLESDYAQPWLRGFRPFVFTSYWKYLDIDTSRRK